MAVSLVHQRCRSLAAVVASVTSATVSSAMASVTSMGLSECVAASSVPAPLLVMAASVTSATTVSSAMALVTMVVPPECVDVGVCYGVGVGDGVVYAGVDVGDDRRTSASVSTLV